MCPSTSCPLSSFTRNIVFGRASVTSPSISIFSSLGKKPRAASRRSGGGARVGEPRRTESDLGYVDRLRALVTALLFIGDLRVLLEALETRSVDAGVVDEEVSITFIRSDKAVSLLVVEPLDGTGCHACSTFLYCGPARSYSRI